MDTAGATKDDFLWHSSRLSRRTGAGTRAWNRLTLHETLFTESTKALALPENELWLPDLVVAQGILSVNGLYAALESGQIMELHGFSEASRQVVQGVIQHKQS